MLIYVSESSPLLKHWGIKPSAVKRKVPKKRGNKKLMPKKGK